MRAIRALEVLMSNDRIDAETLAAFIDGTLTGVERDRVLRVLGEDAEQYRVFADASRSLEEIGADLRSGDAPPSTIGRTRRRWLMMIPVLAAAAVLVVVFPRRRVEGPLSGLVDGAALVSTPGNGSLAAGLGGDWDQPGWTVSRGDDGAPSSSARGFRLGARVVAIDIAREAGDQAALKSLAASVVQILLESPGGGPVAAAYRNLSAGDAIPSRERVLLAAAEARAMGSETAWFDLGEWAEAARLATLAGAFGQLSSESPLARAALEVAGRLARNGDPEAAGVLEPLRRAAGLLRSGVDRERRPAFSAALAALIAAGAR